jgi:hypothetical protein
LQETPNGLRRYLRKARERSMNDDKSGRPPRSGSIKNPEHELEKPAPMPHDDKARGGGHGPDKDPAGQQGGYHR